MKKYLTKVNVFAGIVILICCSLMVAAWFEVYKPAFFGNNDDNKVLEISESESKDDIQIHIPDIKINNNKSKKDNNKNADESKADDISNDVEIPVVEQPETDTTSQIDTDDTSTEPKEPKVDEGEAKPIEPKVDEGKTEPTEPKDSDTTKPSEPKDNNTGSKENPTTPEYTVIDGSYDIDGDGKIVAWEKTMTDQMGKPNPFEGDVSNDITETSGTIDLDNGVEF